MRRNEKGLTLEPARGGWVVVKPGDETGRPLVLLRFYPRPNGRLGVVETVVIQGGLFEIDVANWRSVPIAEATTLANLPEYRRAIVEHLNDGDAELMIGGATGATPILRTRRSGPAYTADTATEPVEPVKRTGHAYRLPQPHGYKFPDEFYKRVAEAFLAAMTARKPPTRTIAEANNVPATTVARWIREARRRELLAPAGGKGRIG